tara:strand:+ start:377 stop:619 length:243 start_codon:yes stop_codon:yes gene_type:complete
VTAKGIEGRVPFFQLGLPIRGVAPLAPGIKAEFRRLINQSTLTPLITCLQPTLKRRVLPNSIVYDHTDLLNSNFSLKLGK